MRFLFLAWFLLSVSSLVFAEPPIEVIYFKPSDVKAPTQDELDFLGDAMVEVQSFFASEMERYGFGPKTFAFNPDITVIKGKRKVADYTQDGMLVNESSLIEGGLDNQIHVVFLGGAETFMGAAGLSRGLCNAPPDQWIFCNNLVVVPTGIPEILLPVLAHEIAHAFYILEHSSERLTENRIDVMHVLVVTPGVKEELGKYAFNPVDATLLNEGGRLAVQDGLNIDSVTPDLVAYYPFDGNTEDASGNGNNGGERGAVEYVEGKFGDAIGLDSGVYVLVPPSHSLHGDFFKRDPFTLSLWVYPKTGTGYGHVWRSLSRQDAGNTLFIIEDAGIISWRGRINGVWSYGDLCETDARLFKADTWLHVAVTNDGDKFRIYLDGKVVAETDFQETDGGNAFYFIGSRFTSGENFVGSIDDFAIFSRALSSEEINSIMTTGVAAFLQATESVAIENSGFAGSDTGDRSDTVSLLPASVQSINIGQQLEFSLKIANGKNVAGYQATVQFDDTALRYVESRNSDYLPDGAFFVPPILEENLVKLNAASLAGESNGDGTLATLTFEVIAVKASILRLSDVLLSNSTGETFAPQIENAEITEPTKLTGDVNGDGTVNIADLVLVASNLGQTGSNAADVNTDGVVNIADLVLVAGALGTSASAPSLHLQALETLTATEVKQWLSAAQRLNLRGIYSQRGILFLQQLLVALTPKEAVLLPNFPNPFNPETWIPYHLAKGADVALHIYAMNGALVRTLTLGHQAAGKYQNRSRAAYWDGKNDVGEPVASGAYFYTLKAGEFTATRKMLIRK